MKKVDVTSQLNMDMTFLAEAVKKKRIPEKNCQGCVQGLETTSDCPKLYNQDRPVVLIHKEHTVLVMGKRYTHAHSRDQK